MTVRGASQTKSQAGHWKVQYSPLSNTFCAPAPSVKHGGVGAITTVIVETAAMVQCLRIAKLRNQKYSKII